MRLGIGLRGAIHAGLARLQAEASVVRSELAHVPGWATVQHAVLGFWDGDVKEVQKRIHEPPPGHEHNKDYRLIREEDWPLWVSFFVIFSILLLFDNCVLNWRHEKLSFGKASLYSVFWIACAGCFNFYIYLVRGYDDAFEWGTGYLLEWMLSVDNLFVFRTIFVVFKTPDEQKHKPLFWGIVGAIVFRMVFFALEEILLHEFWWMTIILGMFLVWTGFKLLFLDEDEADPKDNPVFQFITRHIAFADFYTPNVEFVAKVPIHEETGEAIDLYPVKRRRSSDGHRRTSSQEGPGGLCATPRPMPFPDAQVVYKWRGTRLLMVVICLEVTDIVFAVDSVSAIVAQIPDLFLAYTACVFAMLGLRAMFFVVDELVQLFSLLSYGVALILAFIGLKLMLKTWIHVPPEIMCGILVSTVVLSMALSVILEKLGYIEGGKDDDSQLSPGSDDRDTPMTSSARTPTPAAATV